MKFESPEAYIAWLCPLCKLLSQEEASSNNKKLCTSLLNLTIPQHNHSSAKCSNFTPFLHSTSLTITHADFIQLLGRVSKEDVTGAHGYNIYLDVAARLRLLSTTQRSGTTSFALCVAA